ncbi:hypothetical protein HQ524_04320 [Candidatus Uhrbacteria bacterium]|nr:hypothetical protein [Candidatus Uhrbacteria bacterium]
MKHLMLVVAIACPAVAVIVLLAIGILLFRDSKVKERKKRKATERKYEKIIALHLLEHGEIELLEEYSDPDIDRAMMESTLYKIKTSGKVTQTVSVYMAPLGHTQRPVRNLYTMTPSGRKWAEKILKSTT